MLSCSFFYPSHETSFFDYTTPHDAHTFLQKFLPRDMWVWCLVFGLVVKGAIIVPVQTDRFTRDTFINVSLSGFNEGNAFPILVHLGEQSVIDARLFDGNDMISSSNIVIESMNGVELLIPDFLVVLHSDMNTRLSTLGIGPGSWFVESHGPVNLVHTMHGRSLVINSTYFEQESCQPDSVIVMPVDTVTNTVPQAEFKLNINGQNIVETEPVLSISLSIVGSYMGLPRVIASVAADLLASHGAVGLVYDESGTFTSFRNCTSSMISTLPDIVVSISDNSGIAFGYIIQAPDDYIQFRSGANECAFRFSVALTNERPWMNPIMFEGVNVRIQNTSISFCDPIEQ